MESKLKELVVAYVKADCEIKSQELHLASLKRVRDEIADNLTNRIHEAIGLNDETYLDYGEIYLDYGDGILYCSNHDERMNFERIHTIDVDDLKELKAE